MKDMIYCSECPYFKNLFFDINNGYCLKIKEIVPVDYPYCEIPLQEWYEESNNI